MFIDATGAIGSSEVEGNVERDGPVQENSGTEDDAGIVDPTELFGRKGRACTLSDGTS